MTDAGSTANTTSFLLPLTFCTQVCMCHMGTEAIGCLSESQGDACVCLPKHMTGFVCLFVCFSRGLHLDLREQVVGNWNCDLRRAPPFFLKGAFERSV